VEAILHCVYLRDVRLDAVRPTALRFGHAKASLRKALCVFNAAKVDNRRQPFFLICGRLPQTTTQNRDDVSMKIRGSHLDRVAGYISAIETVEPARIRIVPRALGQDLMVANAIFSRLGERSVGKLKHTDRGRRRPVDFPRVP